MIVSPAGHRPESRANQRSPRKRPVIFPAGLRSFPLGRIISAAQYYRVRDARITSISLLRKSASLRSTNLDAHVFLALGDQGRCLAAISDRPDQAELTFGLTPPMATTPLQRPFTRGSLTGALGLFC